MAVRYVKTYTPFPRTRTVGSGDNEREDPIDHTDNTRHLFELYGITCRYNELTKTLEIHIPGRAFSEERGDDAKLVCIRNLCKEHRVPVTGLEGHMLAIGDDNVYHPVRDWLNTLQWDGESRFKDLLDTLDLDEDKIPKEMPQCYYEKHLLWQWQPCMSQEEYTGQVCIHSHTSLLARLSRFEGYLGAK